MSNYVTDITDVPVEAITEESTAFGDAWVENLAVGVKQMADIELTGFYDDTATTGPDVIFNAPGNTISRTLKLTWGSTKTTSVETIIAKYTRIAKVKTLTKYKVTLRPTGAVTEV
jgi:hypothetical protein